MLAADLKVPARMICDSGALRCPKNSPMHRARRGRGAREGSIAPEEGRLEALAHADGSTILIAASGEVDGGGAADHAKIGFDVGINGFG